MSDEQNNPQVPATTTPPPTPPTQPEPPAQPPAPTTPPPAPDPEPEPETEATSSSNALETRFPSLYFEDHTDTRGPDGKLIEKHTTRKAPPTLVAVVERCLASHGITNAAPIANDILGVIGEFFGEPLPNESAT